MVASCVFTACVVAKTSTVVIPTEICITISLVVGVDTSKTSPLCLTVENPVALMIRLYVEGRTSRNWYTPLLSVCVVRVMPMSGFEMVTAAPGTEAPLRSVMVPRSEAEPPCDQALGAVSKPANRIRTERSVESRKWCSDGFIKSSFILANEREIETQLGACLNPVQRHCLDAPILKFVRKKGFWANAYPIPTSGPVF